MPNFCGVECVCTCAVESSEHGGRGHHGGVFTQPLNELILLCAEKRVHLLAQIARNGKVSGYVYGECRMPFMRNVAFCPPT
jgi:hypothetical protein